MFTNKNAILVGLLLLGGLSANGQSNVFPASGNVGVGITNPTSLFHIKRGGAVAYPSTTEKGNIVQFLQADNNALEIGVANGINSRKAWLLARHATTVQYGQYYATLHLQPTFDDVTQYRGVAIGYPADAHVPVGVTLAVAGKVGIGTSNPQAKLAVDGNILAKEIKVTNNIAVPDYVFEPDYHLSSLSDVEAYVKEHKHLPEIPSAKDIDRDGLDLGEMNLLLLKKVEELTLYLIEQQKEINSLKREVKK
ncbi:hypothetical protein [Sphingobacterium haloxyli]|uniref:Peptidase S74 domain-containing protein n=1 Tax=Sphingobacterium haloxyli TaxID=2100533 RepID=A0A2S9IWS4_9SPHI|nr:hypothetical protein [Sphingobacterium haloxyli]PRD44977.1 hypothetical protein C5745_18930 [Sphingobacterium haloxyli]